MKNLYNTIEDFAPAYAHSHVTTRNLRDALLTMASDAIGIGSTAAGAAEMAASYLTQYGDPDQELETSIAVTVSGRKLAIYHYGNRMNIDFDGWPLDK